MFDRHLSGMIRDLTAVSISGPAWFLMSSLSSPPRYAERGRMRAQWPSERCGAAARRRTHERVVNLSSIIVISSVGGFHSGYVILQSYVDWILGRVGCNVPRVCVARCLWDRRE
jgi:hypothetical protein